MADAVLHFGRILGKRNPMLYGQFIEHFHRQIYDGIYCPGSPLADGDGLRTDVVAALRRIAPPIIRWPGGCFVSAYHWRDGVGERRPSFDKAWRVEDPNTFGTDEFIKLCRVLDSEPYICTNAGTGTAEEMSDWVEYCNLPAEGANARLRIAGGSPAPHGVQYWSIGNENYGAWEIGAKTAQEWARLVTEAAKMMRRVDPSIQLSAAALPDVEWNLTLLASAGQYLDWISIHAYWDAIHETNALATYEQVMAYTPHLDDAIRKVEGMLAATGHSDHIKIAFDEWNLRGWYHPNSHTLHLPTDKAQYLTPRDQNDDNAAYTMADTVFTACFLNTLLRHCDTVHMANFAPTVNTRGLVYAHPEGIVLRGMYHVFDLYVNQMGEEVVDLWQPAPPVLQARDKRGNAVDVAQLDMVATRTKDGRAAIALVNKHPTDTAHLTLALSGLRAERWTLYTVNGGGVDDYNDIRQPDNIRITTAALHCAPGEAALTLAPHSVNVLVSHAG